MTEDREEDSGPQGGGKKGRDLGGDCECTFINGFM